MYSIKPGRGPSIMGGVGGLVAAGLGVAWTVGAASMGAPPFFTLFGLVFVLMAVAGAAYNFYNAAAPDRMSNLDITTEAEESDPISQALGYEHPSRPAEGPPVVTGPRKFPGEFCPFCGAKVSAEFAYCPKCGKDI